MQSLFEAENTEAVLLVDTSNAFNSINRKAALHNIRILCPTISTILFNTYQAPAKLFIVGGEILESQEGTTQGDPLAMTFYALAVLPLIAFLDALCLIRQSWFADDAAAGDTVSAVTEWWCTLLAVGPKYGNNPNPAKTWLIAKPQHYAAASFAFETTGVQVTADGRRYLGATLGQPTFTDEYVVRKVAFWTFEIDRLASFAATQPHAAYAAFTHGLTSEWAYLQRTVTGIARHCEPLEHAIRLS